MSELDYDPHVADEYATHLSEVNRTNQVVATEDIRNERGVLLIKKGMPLDERLAQKVIKHKLVRPIEHSVNLDSVLDAGRLLKHIHSLLAHYPDCQALHERLNLEMPLRACCMHYNGFPLLTQKMTVLSMRLKRDHQKSLFSAWLALAIGRQMALGEDELQIAFLSGLLHDVGMLHLPQEILKKSGELDAAEWRAIQSHPLIAKMFLQDVTALPKLVTRAVVEHHERVDGTGYPAGRFDDQLSPIGQLVAICDTLFAIRMQRFKHERQSLRDLLPILQFSSGLYQPEVYRAAINILRLLPQRLEGIRPSGEMPAYVGEQLVLHQQLRRGFEQIPLIMSALPDQSANRLVRTTSIQVASLWSSVISSGLLAPTLAQWMEMVRDRSQEEYYTHMEEIATMLEELNWQLRQVKKSLRTLIDGKTGIDEAARAQLAKALKRLDELQR